MVDEQDQQPTEESVSAEEPTTTAPRRRRRAASRPAGPPAVVPDSDQAELFAALEPEQGQSAESDAVSDEHSGPEAEQVEPDAEGGAEDPQGDAEADVDADAAIDADAERPEHPSTLEPATDGSGSLGRVESAPTVRRSRRATRGVTTVAFSAEPEPEATPLVPAAEVPLVALFQPPDETRAVRRRRRPAVAAEAEASGSQVSDHDREDDESASGTENDSDEPRARAGRQAADTATDTDADTDDRGDLEDREDDRDDEGAPRRRRRRGGRRRRRSGPGGGEDNGTAEGDDSQDGSESRAQAERDDALTESPDEPADDSEGEGPDGDEAEGGESSSARRRRRRRRRAGVAEEMEDLSSEDPPNTVVKVREARRPKDEITSVRGSTRIEAKKQRRRDGREAGRRRAPILTEAEFLARRESVNRVMCVREHGDRTQIAVLEDGILVEHYVNRAESSSMVGNVYLGKVQNVLPSMEAAFVDIGRGRNAVLYAGEVNWEAAGLEGQPKRIELALKSGDPVLVQVTKDPIGHKGARLTSQISLPGRFLVYVPEGSMTGISRKLPDTERSRLKSILKDVVPDGAGVIVRTAAEGATEEQLTADVTRLAAQWADITKKAKSASPPSLLYGEPDLAIKVVRDIFNEDFTTLLVQGDSTWQTLSDYIGWVAPDLLPKLEKWVEPTDLYASHRIDEQLAKALDRKVWLPSGGSLVIDRTEAMTVVDVNTGKFTGQGGNLEETVTKNNLEAAEEIVRQLRLRDIGGIIVVDFIDMVLESNRDLVLRRLVECLGRDRTKHQVAEVTSLGLVQMTRKRIGQGLLEVFSTPCEHCGGRGHMVHAEPVGLDHQPAEENGNRRDRGGRRAAKPPVPAVLGGKQTGKTPPPPRFDDHGHIEHEEHGHDDHGQHGHEEHGHEEHGQHGHEEHEHDVDGSTHDAHPEDHDAQPESDAHPEDHEAQPESDVRPELSGEQESDTARETPEPHEASTDLAADVADGSDGGVADVHGVGSDGSDGAVADAHGVGSDGAGPDTAEPGDASEPDTAEPGDASEPDTAEPGDAPRHAEESDRVDAV